MMNLPSSLPELSFTISILNIYHGVVVQSVHILKDKYCLRQIVTTKYYRLSALNNRHFSQF